MFKRRTATPKKASQRERDFGAKKATAAAAATQGSVKELARRGREAAAKGAKTGAKAAVKTVAKPAARKGAKAGAKSGLKSWAANERAGIAKQRAAAAKRKKPAAKRKAAKKKSSYDSFMGN